MSEVKRKRMTKQKRIIYEILCATNCHPTADWLYQEARKQLPDISLGTVYRNLQILREDGEIMELNYGKGQSHYDGNARPHYHFVCQRCGHILDFEQNFDCVDNSKFDQAPGRVESYRMECYGVCNDCLSL